MTEETAKAKKPVYKRWWFWVLAVIVLFILIGAISGNKNPQKVDSGQSSADSKDQEQTNFKIGDQVKRGDTVLIVKEVNKDWHSSNQFDKPQSPQNVYVVVMVGIGNEGKKDMSLSGAWDFKLKDGNGAKHDQALGGVGLNRLDAGSTTSLAPGGVIAGALIFEVPSTATDNLTLEYQPLFSFGSPAEIALQ